MHEAMRVKDIIDNKTLHAVFDDSSLRREYSEALPSWVFPLVGYPKARGEIDASIQMKYSDDRGNISSIVLDGISQFKGQKRIALAIPKYDENGKLTFEVVDDPKNKQTTIINVLNADAITVIENFPQTIGMALPDSMGLPHSWHLPENRFGIPTGEKVSRELPSARHLWRSDSAYVGLVVCYYTDFYDVRLSVDVDQLPFQRLGVLVYDKQPPAEKQVA